jgi:hypothetical protein
MYDDMAHRVAARTRSPWPLVLWSALGAFLLGGLAVWTLAGRPNPVRLFKGEAAVTSPAPGRARAPLVASSPETATEAHQAVQQAAQVAQQQGGIDQRVAAMEQRLTRLDLQAQAAEGNASRAEGLLIAFAARRALERGAPLGYLQDQLKLRFGDAQPNAVQAVIDAAAQPVTLDQLLVRLRGMQPTLTGKPQHEGALAWISREVSQLFVVRHANEPSPAAVDRIERARLFLQTGRADLAAAEIRRLNNAAPARQWIADAERYAAAERALDMIETAAIAEPRELRDGAGRRVVQPSPLG